MACVALAAGCTKKNPNLCCTDAADCEAQGLPDDAQCSDGLVCRGNQCIAETCSSAADCDPAAPYCVVEQSRCAETCTVDSQCPGFGQAASDTFCVGGACVACRDGMDDCSGAAPVCDTGACRQCRANSECASGACDADGTCVDEAEIAFTAPDGSGSSDCSRASPCSLVKAAASAKPVIEVLPGAYSVGATWVVPGVRRVIGAGSGRPTITSSTNGPIISIELNADVSLEHLEVFGAKNAGATGTGIGVACHPQGTSEGARTVHLVDISLRSNEFAGMLTNGCVVSVATTSVADNGFYGMSLTDSTATIDRVTVTNSTSVGIQFDEGVFALTNSFVTRNPAVAIRIGLLASQTGARFESNTFADNATSIDNANTVPAVSTRNNLFVRDGSTTCAACDFAGSLILQSAASVKFKSPDVAPFDYHIDATSVAVEAAVPTTIANDHDFDGDPRPQGVAAAVGADEVH